ncbi:helix-turn-helix transcriptional regulator [Demequina sp. NBRC 110054]|uniref:helix-turn-helix domain-containing protein n=1 Tax=Demequina sp. NBRC 110054 TaxID=1570343 RepID=UPI00190EA09A|nr:helix-turn-helix transcriptional regulator [Demequina sp. NBRC 110054]
MPPKRARPRDLGSNWPEESISDAAGEVARLLAIALRDTIDGISLRRASNLTGVDHVTIADILRGDSWPDLITIARLEAGLETTLWPCGLAARVATGKAADGPEGP